MKPARWEGIDLLRATAVIMVTFYHVFQRLPFPSKIITSITDFGKYGVDLFFVISGFLIGSIFWKSLKNKEFVYSTFILKRITRTFPSYFAMLIISYLGVYYFRSEKFDLKYLFFLQNYNIEIPFFSVSWSLCIEEHFYLIFPLLFMITNRFNITLLFAIPLIFLSLILRLNESSSHTYNFGYYTTATHLRLDGISFGFLFSFFETQYSINTQKIIQKKLIIIAFLLISFLYFSKSYILSYFLVSLLFTFILYITKNVNIKTTILKKTISLIAIPSYSIYITQAVSLDISSRIYKLASYGNLFFIFLSFLSIIFFGYLFYFTIERKFMNMRKKYLG